MLADTARTMWLVLMTWAVSLLKLCLLFPTHNSLLIEMQFSQGQGLLLSRGNVCKHSHHVRAVDNVVPMHNVVLGSRSRVMDMI